MPAPTEKMSGTGRQADHHGQGAAFMTVETPQEPDCVTKKAKSFAHLTKSEAPTNARWARIAEKH